MCTECSVLAHIRHRVELKFGGIRNVNVNVNVYLYTAQITLCLMAVYNCIERDRTSACEGATGCRYQSIFDLTHPPNPCMK